MAPTYARLLRRLAQTVTEAEAQLESYYSLWPSAATLSEPWLSLARRVFSEAHAMPLLYSSVAQGKWVSPKTALNITGDGDECSYVRQTLLSDGKVELPLAACHKRPVYVTRKCP